MDIEYEIDKEMIEAAMGIIVDAGDARIAIGEGLSSIENGDFKAAEEKFEEARHLLAKAHGQQTSIIQSESEGTMRQHPLLFIHAQDTLMTINSELNLCKRTAGIFRKLENRLNALEEKVGK
jgi:PTS system cellobiose-specific IIA component